MVPFSIVLDLNAVDEETLHHYRRAGQVIGSNRLGGVGRTNR
jgi:hypothetical protein